MENLKIKRVMVDPAPCLRAKNADVTHSWSELEPLVRKMWKVMYGTGTGVGLAAPQVGWNVRLFVMNPDTKTMKPQAQRVFWNPKILELCGDPSNMSEGCLSLPGVFGKVLRYPRVRLQAMSPRGQVEETFEGFAAQIVQHEVGHLEGKLCWDRFVKE